MAWAPPKPSRRAFLAQSAAAVAMARTLWPLNNLNALNAAPASPIAAPQPVRWGSSTGEPLGGGGEQLGPVAEVGFPRLPEPAVAGQGDGIPGTRVRGRIVGQPWTSAFPAMPNGRWTAAASRWRWSRL